MIQLTQCASKARWTQALEIAFIAKAFGNTQPTVLARLRAAGPIGATTTNDQPDSYAQSYRNNTERRHAEIWRRRLRRVLRPKKNPIMLCFR